MLGTRQMTPRKAGARFGIFLRQVLAGWQLYLMALPTLALLFAFSYMPMFGTLMAFKRFRIKDGILGSPWMQPLFRNFEILFRANSAAVNAIKNTLLLNFMFIIVGTVFALMLALMFNEIRHKTY